ncbi:DUF551 domain-containing protein [Enterobacter hormaechei]
MTIKPVADLYLITYEDGKPYRYTRDADEAIDAIEGGFKVKEFVSLENHRAAMLQGAEQQQNQQQNIPENIPALREAVGTILNSGIAIDGEKILAERDALNSSVIPHGWVACSERLPPEGYEPDGGAVCYLVWHKNEVDCGPQYSISNVFFLRKHWERNFTHWMPLPAAPQQE